MAVAVKAGLVYFAGVFALGFAFGAIRMMFLEPTVGELLAVLIEVPLILAGCWLLCLRAIQRSNLQRGWQARAVMGATAFVCLLIAEFLLATLIFAESPASYLAGFVTAAGALGFAGQVLYGLFPLIQIRFSGD